MTITVKRIKILPGTSKMFSCYLRQFALSLTCVSCTSWGRGGKWKLKILGLGKFWSNLRRLLISHMFFCVLFTFKSKLFNMSHSKIFKQGFREPILHVKMVHCLKKERCHFIITDSNQRDYFWSTDPSWK